jgi:hypothetical protein
MFLRPADDVFELGWKLRAEASVSDSLGAPVSGLPSRVWKVHVTDAVGTTHEPSFAVAKANVSGRVVPGFYLLTIDELRTALWVAPTAFGFVIDRPKGEMHGQVVVPIRYTGPTTIQALTMVPV